MTSSKDQNYVTKVNPNYDFNLSEPNFGMYFWPVTEWNNVSIYWGNGFSTCLLQLRPGFMDD